MLVIKFYRVWIYQQKRYNIISNSILLVFFIHNLLDYYFLLFVTLASNIITMLGASVDLPTRRNIYFIIYILK